MSETASALAATVIAVVPPEGHEAAADALMQMARASSVRPIIVSLGDLREPPREQRDGAVVIRGLVPQYLNNAVASLRLSSLPSLGWWRTPDLSRLPDFAVLVDRLALDQDDPVAAWSRLPELAVQTAVTDLRWASLTRWRDLLAQFYDMPDVREKMATIEAVDTTGADRHQATLFAGWLRSRLAGGRMLALEHRSGGRHALEEVSLRGPGGRIALRLLSNDRCVRTTLELAGAQAVSRVVPFGDQRVVNLLTDELRLRSRDLVFEDAAREALKL